MSDYQEIFEDPTLAEDDLPAFANEENRKLNGIVKVKEQKLEEIASALEDNQSRIKVMSQHLKSVKQEVVHTQQLVDAKNREIETEDHIKQLTEREAGRLRNEMESLEKKLAEFQDRLNVIQNDIFRANEKMDEFKTQMRWNQEELEQWALAAKQKEEDNLALQKYTRADESKVKELNLQIEATTKRVQEKKSQLDAEVTETQTAQIELDRTAEEFRALHHERQQLVKQWEEAIKAMGRRDQEIETATKRYQEAQDKLNELEQVLKDNASRLQGQKDDNKEVESQIKLKERMVAKIREDFTAVTNRLQQFKDEVDILRNELSKVASELSVKKQTNVNETQALEEKKQQLEDARRRYQTAKSRLDSEMKGLDRVEASAKAAEGELAAKETECRQWDRQIELLKERTFKQSQELFQLRQEESNMMAEITGAQAASKNLQLKIHKLDQESLKQQELIYNAEFQIQQLERKVSRAQGIRSDEEKKALNTKIEELQKQLDEHKAQNTFLVNQVKRLSDDLRAARRQKERCEKELAELQLHIEKLSLQNESSQRALDSAVKQKEEIMVRHDVLRLNVKRSQEKLSDKADEVYGLENRNFQLKLSVEERKKEVGVHKEVQKAQIKAIEEERHSIAQELGLRKTRVEKLKAKFEVLVAKAVHRAGDDEDDGVPLEERTQAYYLIRAAQKKEELQREGDELDAKIRKAEREVRALENTLLHLNERNQTKRSSLSRADPSSREAQELKYLEEQHKSASDLLFRKRKELQRLQNEAEEDTNRISQLSEQTRQLEAHVDHLRKAQQQVRQEVEESKTKLNRVLTRMNQLAKAHKRAKGVPEDAETVEDKQIYAHALEENNRNVLTTLFQLGKEYPEIEDTLRNALQHVGLQFPSTRPSSRQSTASRSSVRSDHSLKSSKSNRSIRSTDSRRGQRDSLQMKRATVGF